MLHSSLFHSSLLQSLLKVITMVFFNCLCRKWIKFSLDQSFSDSLSTHQCVGFHLKRTAKGVFCFYHSFRRCFFYFVYSSCLISCLLWCCLWLLFTWYNYILVFDEETISSVLYLQSYSCMFQFILLNSWGYICIISNDVNYYWTKEHRNLNLPKFQKNDQSYMMKCIKMMKYLFV